MGNLSRAFLLAGLLITGSHSQSDNITNCTARQHYVYLESNDTETALPMTSHTLSSTFVNFPPYKYGEIEYAEVVVFESRYASSGYNEDFSNPCDSSTWQFGPALYADTVVMIYYDETVAKEWCSVQKWVLELEAYTDILAVLVVHHEDDDYVSEYGGDANLSDPTVPTRVISRDAASKILSEDDPMVTFGCFEESDYPPEVCMTDMSDLGSHVHLDGEFFRLAGYEYNNHPIWVKVGLDSVWNDLYLLLFVNQTMDGDSHVFTNASAWRWVIVDVRFDVFAECTASQHPEHPAECGSNWRVNGEVVDTLIADNTTCTLGETFLCVESTPHTSDIVHDMNGHFRQSHPSTRLWLREDRGTSEYLATGQLTLRLADSGSGPIDVQDTWAFGVVDEGVLYAFCIISEDESEVTETMKMSPWKCNDWWTYWSGGWGLGWNRDPEMDVDLCDDDENEIVPNVTYEELLCFMPSDYESGDYSHYQGLFGLYELNGEYLDRDLFDGRPFYNQIRLNDVDDGKWHILWFDEHDAWVVNDYIPHETVARGGHVFYYESWCDHARTPENCSTTNWPLYQGYEDIDHQDSTAIVYAVEAGSRAAEDCMPEPEFGDGVIWSSANICFDDGENSEASNPLSGLYVLAEDSYNERLYWVKDEGTEDEMFLFYDTPKRFWVIDDTLGDESYFTSPDVEVYCLQWDQREPWDCDTWYFYNTTANDMPHERIYEVRTTAMQTMRVADECRTDPDAFNAAASAGAVVGYTVAALILVIIVALLFMGKCPCGGKKGTFSFNHKEPAGSLAAKQSGGMTSTGMQEMEMGSPSNGGTAGRPNVKRTQSMSSVDGDLNETR